MFIFLMELVHILLKNFIQNSIKLGTKIKRIKIKNRIIFSNNNSEYIIQEDSSDFK